jgi:hypothetical protein
MKPVRVGIPKQVVDDVRNVLDRPIVGRKGIDEQVMPKILQEQKRAFDEGVVVRQVLIVPNKLSLERREVDRETQEREDNAANPGALEESAYLAESRLVSNTGCRSGS